MESAMTFNHNAIYYEIEKLLSKNPAIRLCELEKQLKCSRPTIRKTILKKCSIGYREYQNQKLLETSVGLLQKGVSVKVVALELGYKWPENYSRFMHKAVGGSPSKIRLCKAKH